MMTVVFGTCDEYYNLMKAENELKDLKAQVREWADVIDMVVCDSNTAEVVEEMRKAGGDA
jgi:hypothetical protein